MSRIVFLNKNMLLIFLITSILFALIYYWILGFSFYLILILINLFLYPLLFVKQSYLKISSWFLLGMQFFFFMNHPTIDFDNIESTENINIGYSKSFLTQEFLTPHFIIRCFNIRCNFFYVTVHYKAKKEYKKILFSSSVLNDKIIEEDYFKQELYSIKSKFFRYKFIYFVVFIHAFLLIFLNSFYIRGEKKWQHH
ncbi:Uncharacterised protein [Suttonella indologenes]|uniref:Uncharacterized protein n=2 Tax=Suttonella indologenes TaxID=13276 RepID=A0A380N077_9GAMM|nr:Uncharacterised protein [Suttonella indologenes]